MERGLVFMALHFLPTRIFRFFLRPLYTHTCTQAHFSSINQAKKKRGNWVMGLIA
jgi:hypothetical protein